MPEMWLNSCRPSPPRQRLVVEDAIFFVGKAPDRASGQLDRLVGGADGHRR
jgi:hypothetical protein